ncbi:MAG TPA: hypothetical protein VM912_04680 [Terriglobales bacterium]|nr:hypothetical protein [Terriglobales bacterium]
MPLRDSGVARKHMYQQIAGRTTERGSVGLLLQALLKSASVTLATIVSFRTAIAWKRGTKKCDGLMTKPWVTRRVIVDDPDGLGWVTRRVQNGFTSWKSFR